VLRINGASEPNTLALDSGNSPELCETLVLLSFYSSNLDVGSITIRSWLPEPMPVRISSVELCGKKQYVAEMIGQAGSNVTYMRMVTLEALTDEDYLEMARLGLDRLAERAK
jgi:hypothetical protein